MEHNRVAFGLSYMWVRLGLPSVIVRFEGVHDSRGDLVGDSVLVEEGRIARVGFGLRSGHAGEVLEKGYAMPGLVDAHAHLAGLGLSLRGADLRGARSVRDIVDRLSRVQGPLAYGRGFDEESLEERRLPTRRELDAIQDRPAVAVRVCGHLAVANTLALTLTEPWRRYPRLVDRERGVLLEDAVGYVLEKLMGGVDLSPYVEDAVRAYTRAGVVGMSSMGCSESEARAIRGLAARGRLGMWVSCYVEPGIVEEWLGVAVGRFSVVGVKLFSDGSLGARTAFLSTPYRDEPSTRGRLLLDRRRIASIAEGVLRAGGRVAVHAIGDAALEEVIAAYETLNPGVRARVEHASLARNDQIQRLAGLGVHVVVQPRFRVSDWWIEKRVGRLAALAYRFSTMRRSGVRLALSTDAPVEPYDPRETLYAALPGCRECVSGEPLQWREALEAYTRASAEASGGVVAGLGEVMRGYLAVFTVSPVPVEELFRRLEEGDRGVLLRVSIWAG